MENNANAVSRQVSTPMMEQHSRDFPQPVSVQVTNRNQTHPSQHMREHSPLNINAASSSSGSKKRTLLIDDSILKTYKLPKIENLYEV